MRTRVKICGITRVEDGVSAAAAGADAIGLVFYPGSPRFVEVDRAAAVAAALPPFVTKVALFVDAAHEEIEQIVARVPIDLIQFHGNESPDFCSRQGKPYIKAIRMQPGVDLHAQRERYHHACGLLVDSYKAGVPGGTGEIFNWSLIPDDLAAEITLAGGLNPDNVAAAIDAVHPWGVDVSGGVEAAKGIKDAAAIERLIRGVELGDRNTD
ncbi:MAG: phosphoribosylanthranilate isomerase [Pseudomonadota bacterium]